MNDRFNPKHPLHGAFTKCERAAELARELRTLAEANSHNEGTSKLASKRTDTEVAYSYLPLALPFMWSVRLGEVIHNCRSALDHIVTAFVLRDCPTAKPNRDNAFPICKTKTAFAAVLKDGRKLRLVAPDGVQLIESFQPFAQDGVDPLSMPIYLLDELWQIDKHRVVQLLDSEEFTLLQLDVERVPGDWCHPLGAIARGTAVYRTPVPRPNPKLIIQCRVDRPVCITDTGSARPSSRGLGEVLDTLVRLTDEVLIAADRQFPIYP